MITLLTKLKAIKIRCGNIYLRKKKLVKSGSQIIIMLLLKFEYLFFSQYKLLLEVVLVS